MNSNDCNATHSFRYNNGGSISSIVPDTAGALIRCVSETNNLVIPSENISRDGYIVCHV